MQLLFQVLYIVYKKTGNEYKLMPFSYGPKSFCVFTAEEKIFYPDIIKFTNFPPIPSCDFPVGVYTVTNYVPNIDKLPPIFESGDYAMEVKLFIKGTYINGYTLYASILNFADRFG